jgi:hypothetical protein
MPLPAEPYQYAEWRRARVAPDYHVEVQGHFYSVPSRMIRQVVEVRATEATHPDDPDVPPPVRRRWCPADAQSSSTTDAAAPEVVWPAALPLARGPRPPPRESRFHCRALPPGHPFHLPDSARKREFRTSKPPDGRASERRT